MIAKSELKYLFSWDDIPENVNKKFTDYVKQKLGAGQITIEKYKNNRIRVSTNERFLLLILNDEKTGVNVELDSKIIDSLISKTEKNKLNVYELFFQTLNGHTTDALKILKAYIERNSDVIEQFCERWQLDKESLLRSMFLIVSLHDIGKLTEQFQKNIKNGKHSQQYPHAYYGLFVLNAISFPVMLDNVPIEKAAILGHHTQLHTQLYEGYEKFIAPKFFKDEISAFVSRSKDSYHELSFDQWFSFDGLALGDNSLLKPKSFFGELTRQRIDLITQINTFQDKEKLKSIFSYVFSILETCDDYSSANFSEFVYGYNGSNEVFDSVMIDPAKLFSKLYTDNPRETVLDKNVPYDYQKDDRGKLCGDVPFYGLLFAPCGRGKTEAALIWALKAMKKYKRNKIIFAMPTQITSNALWERFCELFGEGNSKEERTESGKEYVGLFHGKSFVKLQDEKEREKEDDEELTDDDVGEVRDENFKGNIFFKPITITTIDHLLYAFIHGFSQADFALGNIQNAIIIFDEVHYYEKLTLEHIMTVLRILSKMKIPNLLMSGTLPDFFVKKVKDVNGEYAGPFVDEEGINFKPFRLNQFNDNLVTRDGVNYKIIDEIVENYRKGLVQFIILNTVERSKSVYEALINRLPEESSRIVLNHAQFTYSDRAAKEVTLLSTLKKEERLAPFILIATQVIEISLDISCDVMYTEIAPADAIGQRGGRLNRGGSTWISKNGLEYVMNVFRPAELDDENPKKCPYDQNLLMKTIELMKNQPYSYSELKRICDEVYSGYTLTTPTNLKLVFKKCCLFGYRPYDINFKDEEQNRLIQIRSDERPTFDVIPSEYYADDEKNLTVKNQARVPIWWYKQNEGYFKKVPKKVGKNEKFFWVTTIPYSKQKGFNFKEKNFIC